MGCAGRTLSEAHLPQMCGNQVISQPPDQEVGFSISQKSLPSFAASRSTILAVSIRGVGGPEQGSLHLLRQPAVREQGDRIPPATLPTQPLRNVLCAGNRDSQCWGVSSGHTGLALASGLAFRVKRVEMADSVGAQS